MDSDDVIAFKGESFLEILLIDYRWIVACFLLLPASFLYDLYFYVRTAIIFYLNTAPKAHDEKVRNIQRQVCVFSHGFEKKKHGNANQSVCGRFENGIKRTSRRRCARPDQATKP